MKTMESIAYNFLQECKKNTFNEIWEKILFEMQDEWKDSYLHASEKEIHKSKIGELYVILTSKGEFIKLEDEWTLTEFYSYMDVQKMKINVTELEGK